MGVITTESQFQTRTRDLRRRAEARLKRELSINKSSPQHEVGRQLYELRVNQIEIELLSDEFNKLRKKDPVNIRTRQAQNSSRFGYIFLDRESRIFEVKFSAAHPVNENARKWSGRMLDDCIAPDKCAIFHDFLHEVFDSGEKKSCELMFEPPLAKKRLGLKMPLYASIEGIADDEKRFCLAVVEDISTRKIAEEREIASNAALLLLNQTIAASRNEIFMFDAHSLRFTFANQRALENLGYTMDELKWLTPADIQSHIYNQEMDDLIAYLTHHKKHVKTFNAVHLRKDGSLYPVEIYLQLFEQETGSSYIAIALDVSNQKAVESQLQSIVESASAIIWAADANLKLVFMSDQVLDILGYRAEQFVGASLADLVGDGFLHDSDKALLRDGLNQVVKEGRKLSDLRYRAKHADGTWRWFSVNMTPNRSVDGRVSQIVGVMHDIHAQKMAEDALLKLNQELDSRVHEEIQKNIEKDFLLQRQSRLAGMGEMIGNIAHQWRQPINSLGLILSDLEDASLYGECDFAYIQTAVGKSKKIIQKMSSTIDDFRHFFRTDKSLGMFSLKQVTDECLNLVDAAMKSSNINILVRCEYDVVVSGYASEYSQAVMNILSNARDAIVEQKIAAGEIVIEIGEEGEFGVHSVIDNGGGIPAEVLPKIFEPHFTTKEHGVGIGLYMTLVSIEKNMHGRIAVENREKGAKFSVYLPKVRAGDDYVIH